ncbi:MAG: enoyl-CoA hydratase/isomerase family protein [Chloroflexota bacterium]
MSERTVSYDKKGKVAYLTLSRPERGNTLDAELAGELVGLCRAVNQDEEVNVVVVAAAGEAFSVESDPGVTEAAAQASQALASVERVVIAAINGDAFGSGLELALACDIRIASENARFCLPHTADGLIPSAGGTQRLPRLVGRGKALEMLLTADPIDAQEALRIGLANAVVSPDQLHPHVEELAQKIAVQGRFALMYAKEAVTKGTELTLEQGLRLEADLYFLIHTTEDRMEGIRSFLEKRKPEFKGR